MENEIVVIGGGVAGISAAISCAQMGRSVLLVEEKEKLGGRLNEFCCKATDSCSFCSVCTSNELVKQIAEHPAIKIFLNSKVNSVSSGKNYFHLEIKRRNKIEKIKAATVILAVGNEIFDYRSKNAVSFCSHPDIVDAAGIEKILRATGKIVKPSDTQPPKKIAFIQCVGSRSRRWGSKECSRVCCSYAVRLARRIKWENSSAEITIFYIDFQPVRKIAFDLFKEFANELRFIRGIPSEVSVSPENFLGIKFEDADSGALKREEFDMVIPSVGIIPRGDSLKLAEFFGIEQNSAGFFKAFSVEEPSRSSRDGVFIAGTCAGPKDMKDSGSQGRTAALSAVRYIEGKE